MRISTNEMSKSDLICIDLHFLILTEDKINRELTKELIKAYLETDWVVNELNWEEYMISLLVDKNWAFFSFEKRYIQRFTHLTYLTNEYYSFEEGNDRYLIINKTLKLLINCSCINIIMKILFILEIDEIKQIIVVLLM